MELDGSAGRAGTRTGELDAPYDLARHRLDSHALREQARHLHRLGVRPVGELLVEVLGGLCSGCRDLVHERLEHYAELDPDLVRLFGAGDWLDQAAVIRLVTGGRP